MTDTTAFVLIAVVAAVFFPWIYRHARETDRLEEVYRNRIRDHHPGIQLERKRGIVQYLVIDGVTYPSSIVDFRSALKKAPEKRDNIIDEYLASIPRRYESQGRRKEA